MQIRADYLRGEFVEENEDSYGRDAHTTVYAQYGRDAHTTVYDHATV